MYTYGKDYIMGLMKKQGELSSVPDGALHREKQDSMIAGPTDRDALQVSMPRKANPDNKFDPAVFKMADQKDY
jgi:hypothetical protein|tara:strand:- start:1338 stop:1556 length:219 start_codon:yes stop_codon:yes gene_type:complete